jgi:hypothetical protein
VPKSLRLPHRHVLRALALPARHVALCYTPIVHLDPLLTPIKGRTRALLEKVGRAGTRTGQALSWGRSLPSPAWTLVTPYCKHTRPGRGTNTKAAGFPPLSRRSPAASLFSPLRARPRARPIWAGACGDTHSSARGTPRSRNADNIRSASPCQIHQLQPRFLSRCSTPEPSPVAVHPFPRCRCAGPVATTRWRHGKTSTPFANSFPDPLLGGKQHRKREEMSAMLHRWVTTQPSTLVRCLLHDWWAVE